MIQKEIIIDKCKIPVIVDSNVEYYPIKFISTKLLKRSNDIVTTKDKYNNYIRKFIVTYSETNKQETNCISREGLIKRLENTDIKRLSVEQRKLQNKLHKYLGINLITEKQFIVNINQFKGIKHRYKYDDYTLECITSTIEKHDIKQLQLCNKCEKYYPLHNNFYSEDERTKNGFFQTCNKCNGKVKVFRTENKEVHSTVKNIGEDLYNAYMNEEIEKIYESVLRGKISKLPDCYHNRESYGRLIKYLYNKKKINVEEINFETLENKYKLENVKKVFGKEFNQVYISIFGEDCIYYPWKYKNMTVGKYHSFENGKIILDNFIKDKDIVIEDIFNFDYGNIVNKAKIRLRDLLGFVVYYHDHKFAGYKFKTAGKNYYKNEENVLFDLKYLVEKDMYLEIEKIPLYLTKTYLRRNVNPLYIHIIQNKNGTIFQWVDKLYPNLFNERDFDINYYRDEFDSVEEQQVHDILKSNVKNVMYNARNTDRTITIEGIQPDWIVIGKEKCWFIEYFGMYVENGGYNSRTNMYAEKMNRKLDVYKNKLGNYGQLFIYPDDLKNNFEGLREKIKVIM